MAQIPSSIARTATWILPDITRITRPALAWISRRTNPLPGPVVVRVKGGFAQFEIRDIHEQIQGHIYFLGSWEPRESRVVRKYLSAGDTFIDVGANIGWFTLLAARCVGPKGAVVAFEPVNDLHEHLVTNIRQNGFQNVRAEKLAVSDAPGTATLAGRRRDNSGTGGIFSPNQIGAGDFPPEVVQTVPLDEYIAGSHIATKGVDFIKIDAEGAEMQVLKGMQKLLESGTCRYILFEVNRIRLAEAGATPRQVLSYLEGFGYSLYRVTRFGEKPILADTDVLWANVLGVRS